MEPTRQGQIIAVWEFEDDGRGVVIEFSFLTRQMTGSYRPRNVDTWMSAEQTQAYLVCMNLTLKVGSPP